MKYALILPDGAADEPLPQLDGRTPLEAADTPNLDWIATQGRQGCLRTIPEGFTPASDVATLSVMGYNPAEYYAGRAPLEAVAHGIKTRPDDLVFRCNLVTIAEGCMADFTAGHISQAEAERLIADLQPLGEESAAHFHVGISYRHLLVLHQAADLECRCTPPHDIPDECVAEHLPDGPGADRVRALMDRARRLLADHEVNLVRRDLGQNAATDIWLWGQGRVRPLPTLQERFGVRGACIAAVDLINGLARSAGLRLISVPGATGYLDTDYGAKGRAGVQALADHDLVVIHIEAPDEAGHLGDAAEKVKAIEQVDARVVGPMLAELRRADAWRIAVVPDHPTPVATRKHSAVPPCFCLAGAGIAPGQGLPFCEKHAAVSDLQIDPGHEFMEFFLKA